MSPPTLTIESDRVIVSDDQGEETEYDLGSAEAFRLISDVWLRAGWDTKHVYSFTWMGRPIIQLPEDMIRLQEVIYRVRPDVIIETGVAHGGSLIFYASLCEVMGRGRVIGVDVEIRPWNRKAIEEHPLFDWVQLIEGDSTAPEVVEQVKSGIRPGETVMVLLDSCHTKEHVLAELAAYGPLVTPGSYIVAMDGIMGHLEGAPRTEPDWEWNNPEQAAREFAAGNEDFAVEEPAFQFNEGAVEHRVTYWPGGFIRRLR